MVPHGQRGVGVLDVSGDREEAEEETDDLQREGDVKADVAWGKLLVCRVAGRENDETQEGAESWRDKQMDRGTSQTE